MTVEWTNQHGCGGNANVNCNVVLQYMCQPDSVTATGTDKLRLFKPHGVGVYVVWCEHGIGPSFMMLTPKCFIERHRGTMWFTHKATIWFIDLLKTGPNLIELLSTTICLAWSFFLDNNRITNQISICCILLVTWYSAVVCLSWNSRWKFGW